MNVQANSFLTIPSRPVTQTQTRRPPRTKFEFPETGSDTLFPYVTAVKQDSPIYSFCIGGINFDRFVLPSCASLQSNEGKFFAPKYIVRLLTIKQAEAIQKRAEEIVLIVPKRQNLKFSGKDGEQEYLPSQEIRASDIMILVPVDKFNPVMSPIVMGQQEQYQQGQMQDQMMTKDELYKQQRDKNKK